MKINIHMKEEEEEEEKLQGFGSEIFREVSVTWNPPSQSLIRVLGLLKASLSSPT